MNTVGGAAWRIPPGYRWWVPLVVTTTGSSEYRWWATAVVGIVTVPAVGIRVSHDFSIYCLFCGRQELVNKGALPIGSTIRTWFCLF